MTRGHGHGILRRSHGVPCEFVAQLHGEIEILLVWSAQNVLVCACVRVSC